MGRAGSSPAPGTSSRTSPSEPELYGEFVEMVLRRFEGRFQHVELWNEPNNYIEWDWTIDPEWTIFAEMIGGAAARASKLGVDPVLGGMSPFDPTELSFAGRQLVQQQGRVSEVYLLVLLLYLLMAYPLTRGMLLVERWMARRVGVGAGS